MKTIQSTWAVRTYDVWGNKEDGYDVNDSYSHGEVELRLKITVNNEGHPSQFESAYPSDYQLRRVFGVGCQLDVTGDDVSIYVNRASDGYPIGELACTSHESLSPIRKAAPVERGFHG